jgi:hypothetical protein
MLCPASAPGELIPVSVHMTVCLLCIFCKSKFLGAISTCMLALLNDQLPVMGVGGTSVNVVL